ncbi:MAG TPA: PRC-barrel domain-containing protein [Thermodesulfobacteriota bacterium]|nr:PRC-barrel domain-containing protein [Thermodesulfobacteriota bacterium]
MATVKGTERKRDVMSASTLIGDNVVNSQGEDLGSIEEIMIHVPSGRIAYAVLSFGGFLGMGDKLFALPWEALTLDEDNKQFILNIDKEKLENAPGFDKDNWPDMADPQFGRQIHTYYGYPYDDFGGSLRGSQSEHHGDVLGGSMGSSPEGRGLGSSDRDCLEKGTC